MFHSPANRLHAWLSRVDDLLADHPDESQAPVHDFYSHPHRRPLRWERSRREGSVSARPAYCLSPVRASRDAGARSAATR